MPEDDDTAALDRRQRGLEAMRQAYGWDDLVDSPGEFFGITVEHLFADIWTREGLSARDRRLLIIGVAAGLGELDVCGLQMETALKLDQLDAEALREVVIFLTHYVGWPRGAKLNTLVETALAKQDKHKEH